MKTTTTLLLFLAFCACATETAPPVRTADTAADTVAPAHAAPMPELLPVNGDCDLTTPLVPGVPGSPGHLIVSSRNPNGDSELSWLMRHFVDDLLDARGRLQRGEETRPLLPTHRRMRCAWPTKAEERNATYDGMAQSYLAAVEAFDSAPSRAALNGMVQSCIACHSMSCTGPIDMIRTLGW